MKIKKSTHSSLAYITHAGVIAAVYAALTLVLQPLSFGVFQIRIAELLTVLPVYTPAAVPGLTVGCFLSNLVGLSAGANPAGGWDLLFGSAATAVAAWVTRKWGTARVHGLPLWSTLPPVVINALVVGTELFLVYGGLPWWLHVAAVAGGQAVACVGCGLLLAAALEKTGVAKRL